MAADIHGWNSGGEVFPCNIGKERERETTGAVRVSVTSSSSFFGDSGEAFQLDGSLIEIWRQGGPVVDVESVMAMAEEGE